MQWRVTITLISSFWSVFYSRVHIPKLPSTFSPVAHQTHSVPLNSKNALCNDQLPEQVKIWMDECRVRYKWNVSIRPWKRTPHAFNNREDLNEGHRHPEICHWFTLENNAWAPVACGGQSLWARIEQDSQYDVEPQEVWRPLPPHNKKVYGQEDNQKKPPRE